MPNTNAAFGLRPVRHASGAPYNGASNRYVHPAADGTALFVGDPVIGSGTSDGGYPTCIRATAAGGAYITGVVVGFEIDDTLIANGYCPASTRMVVLVADDPDLEFEIQEDAVGGALAITGVMGNADLIAGTGSTVTRLSAFQLDSSTAATTNTLQLRVLGFVDTPDNTPGDAYANVRVSINLHSRRNLTGI